MTAALQLTGLNPDCNAVFYCENNEDSGIIISFTNFNNGL